MKQSSIELLEEKIKFQMKLAQMDRNNGVEWSMSIVYSRLNKLLTDIEQAKQMHKQETFDAWENGFREFYDGSSTPEQYYKETYEEK